MALDARARVFRTVKEMGHHLHHLFDTVGDSKVVDPLLIEHGHTLLLALADPEFAEKAREIGLFTEAYSGPVLQRRLQQLIPGFLADLAAEDDLARGHPFSSSLPSGSSFAGPSSSNAPLSPPAPPAKRSRSGDTSGSSAMQGVTSTGRLHPATFPNPSLLSEGHISLPPSRGRSVSSRGSGHRSATGSQAGPSDGGLKRKRKDTAGK